MVGPVRIVRRVLAGPTSLRDRPLFTRIGTESRVELLLESRGAASRGLRVSVRGDAIDRGLAVPKVARALPARGKEETRPVVQGAAALTETGIPSGVEDHEAVAVAAAAGDTNAQERIYAIGLRVEVLFEVRRVGVGAVEVSVAPAADPSATVSRRVTLDIRAPRRPLRFCESTRASTALLELDRDETLFGLVTLAGAPRECSPAIRAALDEWHAVLSARHPGNGYLLEASGLGRGGLRFSQLAADGLLESRRWANLHNQLGRAGVVHLAAMIGDLPPGVPTAFVRGYHGFSVNRVASRLGAPTTTVGLWLDRESWGDDTQARESLVRILDDALREGPALQALAGRWGWGPKFAEPTPYEVACGVFLAQPPAGWCEAWLRGVSDVLWLGAPLLERIGSDALERLGNLAAASPVGRGLRLVSSRAGLAGVESVLAPILPGDDDARAFVARAGGTSCRATLVERG